ncbi:MAG: ABC transporter substrate-binding protein, partial [Actinomycetota bacterium]|nr:ABC transporter substrate-binding protein [Actinomycetota bacterium]
MPMPAATAPDSLVVGLVGTFSGAGVYSGEDAFEGADLGVQVLNRRREDGQRAYELVTLDDRGSPRRARRLVERLAASERTVGVVYAGPPQALPRAEAALARAGIPAVLCYGDLYSARRLTPHIFQASPPLLWQSRRIASYLFEDRGYLQVGALVGRSFTGSTALAALRSALEEDGRTLAAAARYRRRRGREDLRRSLERLRRARVEAVVVEGSPGFLPEVQAALGSMRARYRTTPAARIASAPAARRARRLATSWWKPQLAAFDLALAPARPGANLAAGTVASESYARGVHYLPVPSFRSFRRAFVDWWGARPLGLEGRAYEATRIIGWGLRRAEAGDDL